MRRLRQSFVWVCLLFGGMAIGLWARSRFAQDWVRFYGEAYEPLIDKHDPGDRFAFSP